MPCKLEDIPVANVKMALKVWFERKVGWKVFIFFVHNITLNFLCH
jgi:hypothetical protein